MSLSHETHPVFSKSWTCGYCDTVINPFFLKNRKPEQEVLKIIYHQGYSVLIQVPCSCWQSKLLRVSRNNYVNRGNWKRKGSKHFWISSRLLSVVSNSRCCTHQLRLCYTGLPRSGIYITSQLQRNTFASSLKHVCGNSFSHTGHLHWAPNTVWYPIPVLVFTDIFPSLKFRW